MSIDQVHEHEQLNEDIKSEDGATGITDKRCSITALNYSLTIVGCGWTIVGPEIGVVRLLLDYGAWAVGEKQRTFTSMKPVSDHRLMASSFMFGAT